jgi:anti-anti-sigma factor
MQHDVGEHRADHTAWRRWLRWTVSTSPLGQEEGGMAEARPLDVRVQRGARDDTTVVQAAGELDFTSINRLRAVLLPLVARGTVVLEATEVTFCDSAGLLAILQANRDARAQGAVFRLAAPSAPLIRVIELAGALGVLEVFPDTEAALAG